MKKKYLLVLFLSLFLVNIGFAYPIKDGRLLQGFGKKISGTDIQYESHVPDVKQAIIVRTTKNSEPIEWESEAVNDKALGKTVDFVFTTGLSNTLPGKKSADFILYVNNQKLLTFNIINDKTWTCKGDGATLTFEQSYKDSRDDCFGYLFLTVPAKYLSKGQSAKFKIEAAAGDENKWVMIFQSPIENKAIVSCTPSILKNSKKQVVKLQYSHFGAPTKATIEFGSIKQTQNLVFGINNIELAITPVTKETKQTLKVITPNGTITSDVDLKPVKEWKVNFVQHSHTDIGYTRSQHEILAEHIRFIDYALDYCDLTDSYPDDAKFRWTCETAWAVSEYIRTRPQEQIDRLKKRINEGRIEVTAMYFNYDELPGEQELAYSLYPLKMFKKEGIKVQSALQNDVNGIAWSFSEFFPELGVKYVIMGTHGHKALISFDMPTAFWWESPSGKKTLTYRAEHYNHGNFLQVEKGDFEMFEKRTLDYLNSLESKNYPHDIASVQYSGYFTDNSPPSIAGSDMIRKWNEKYSYPKLRQALPAEFMSDIEKRYGDKLQTIRGAWPDWWTDGFGSAAREASITRYAQADIISNQIGLSLAKILGAKVAPSVNREIDEANKALLFYGEHTFGFHSSVRDPFHKETMEQRAHKAAYAWESYRRTRPIGETALGLLQTYVPRNKDNASISVFNPMNWVHSGQTIIYADHEVLPINKKVIVIDENGKEASIQIIRSYADASYWALWVDNIPALGAKNYTIKVTDLSPVNSNLDKTTITTIENKWYRIQLDTKNGVVTEWFDKDLNKNLLSNNAKWKMGELIYERDEKRGLLDQLKPGIFTRFSPENVKYEGLQQGDIWDTYKFIGTSPAGMDKDNFTMELRVYKTTKQVNFNYKLKKKLETEPEALYVSFPFELNQGKIYFDVPGGVIQAGVDQIPGSTNDWNTVQNFAAVRNASEQIVLGSPEIPLMQFGNINLGRFKAGATPETNHIFTWPMNNYWVTNFNADQHGEFEWNYFLTSSNDPSIEYATKFAWGNRVPLQTRIISAGVSNNNKPLTGSILNIEQSNILLVNMTPLEGENALMLQLREIGGKNTPFTVSSSYHKSLKVQECSPIGDVLPNSSINFKPWENKFVKIVLE